MGTESVAALRKEHDLKEVHDAVAPKESENRNTDSTASVGPSLTPGSESAEKHRNKTTNTYFSSTLSPRGDGPHGSKAYEVASVSGTKAMGVMVYPANETMDGGVTTS